MSIQVMAKTEILTQAEFHAIDEKVMGVVFDMHNEFGRFLDEQVYKGIIAERCQAAGIMA